MKDYEKQATDFLKRTSVFIDINFSHNGKHFYNDNQVRDIYDVTIKRGDRKFTFKFGQSVINSQYYQDRIPNRTYSLDGKSRTGNYSINDLKKYNSIEGQIKLVKGIQPTEYTILSCLTKYNPGTLEDFARNLDIVQTLNLLKKFICQ